MGAAASGGEEGPAWSGGAEGPAWLRTMWVSVLGTFFTGSVSVQALSCQSLFDKVGILQEAVSQFSECA